MGIQVQRVCVEGKPRQHAGSVAGRAGSWGRGYREHLELSPLGDLFEHVQSMYLGKPSPTVRRPGRLPVTSLPLLVAGCSRGRELFCAPAERVPTTRRSPQVKAGVCSKLLHPAEVSAKGVWEQPLLHKNSKIC